MTTLVNILDHHMPIEEQARVTGIISHMLSTAQTVAVKDDSGFKMITSLYRNARAWKKVIEAKRKEMLEPYRKKTVAINDAAKKLSDPIDQIIDIANQKTDGYHRMLAEEKRKEEEALRLAAASFAPEEPIYVPPMEKSIRGEGAATVTKTVKKFRLTDIEKVPKKYLMVNEEQINLDIKLGLVEIPGIEIYEETTTQLRVR